MIIPGKAGKHVLIPDCAGVGLLIDLLVQIKIWELVGVWLLFLWSSGCARVVQIFLLL